ncbi:MAG: TonB-dependent receptor, partial [Bacteroidota bacterium]
MPVSAQFPEYSFINSGAEFYVFDIHNLENTGTGSNVGVELTVERRINKGYYVLLTSSIFESTYIDYNGVTRNTAFNTNYNSNILVGYEFNINEELMFTCDIRTAMSGGKPYIPIDLEASIEKGQTVYNADLLYEKRYDSYFRTDIRLGLKQNGKKFSQEWGLDLQNVSNHKNIFHQEFDARNEEILPVYQQGFMPMMLYRIRF